MKKRIMLGLLAIVMAVTGFMTFGKQEAAAASASQKYVRIDADANPAKKKAKVGKYYFWMEGYGDNMALFFSKKKAGKGKLVTNQLDWGACGDPSKVVTNGKYVFFSNPKGKGILRKNMKNGKSKNFKIPGMGYVDDFHVYGNEIYILKTAGSKPAKVIVYNMKTKKVKTVKKLKKLGLNNELIGKGRYVYIFHPTGKKVKFLRYDIKKNKRKTVRTVQLKAPVDGHEFWGYNIYFGGGGYAGGTYNYLTNKLTK